MKKLKVFLIMPFDAELNDLYTFIKSILSNNVVEVFRADDLLNQQNILKDVVISIYQSDLIIADLTGLNPNVFYELGLAHAFRKDVILLTQDINELPFDLRSYRVVHYSTNFMRIKELEEKLKKMVSDFQAKTLSFGSPVTDWIPENLEYMKELTPIEHNEVIDIGEIIIKEESYEEKGFLDYMADMEDSMSNLVNIAEDFSTKTEDMGVEVSQYTSQIQTANKNPSSGTASYVRKVARQVAKVINDYGLFVSKSNKEYEDQWVIFEDSITNLILNPRLGDDEKERVSFLSFISTLESMNEGFISAKEGIQGMLEGTNNIKGIEGSLTRAANRIEEEVKRFLGLIEKSMSTIERVVVLGKENYGKLIEFGSNEDVS